MGSLAPEVRVEARLYSLQDGADRWVREVVVALLRHRI
jgi:hypothetical protein